MRKKAIAVLKESIEGYKADLEKYQANKITDPEKFVMEDNPHASIKVFDSLSASAGQGLIVSMILQLEDTFKQFNEVCSRIEEFIKNMCTIFVLEDLTFLEKNGICGEIS